MSDLPPTKILIENYLTPKVLRKMIRDYEQALIHKDHEPDVRARLRDECAKLRELVEGMK